MKKQNQLDQTFHFILETLIATGKAPHYTELSRIIGVEPDDADAMYRSLKKKSRVVLPQVGIFADAILKS